MGKIWYNKLMKKNLIKINMGKDQRKIKLKMKTIMDLYFENFKFIITYKKIIIGNPIYFILKLKYYVRIKINYIKLFVLI